MSRFRLNLVVGSVAAALVVSSASSASAALSAYEGYDYPTSSGITGEEGGSGWANAWSGSTPSGTGGAREIRSPGATYPSLQTVGNKAFIAATNQTQRTLSAGVQGTGDQTLWISFIGQRLGDDSARFFGLSFYEGSSASGNERFTVGEPSDNANDLWGMHFTSSAQGRVEAAGASIFTESLLLARIDYHAAANDDISLWVNPDLSLGEAGLGTADASSIGLFNLAFDIVSTRGGTFRSSDSTFGQALFDEIRIGDTFGDVTPIPEPASLALLGLGGLTLLRRRRRA